LVGEYRGWTTLEAWADRSVRKWQEAGLIPDPPAEEEKGKAVEKVGLGVLALANTTASSGAEVPIPVFADVSNVTPSQPKRQDPDGPLEPPSRAPVPVISITKPPAPLPVDLPTCDDITLDPHSETLHHDLESGGSLMEISHLSKSGQDDGSINIPLTQRAANDTDSSPLTSRAPVDPLPKVANLLDDSVPALAASPMKPSPSAGSSPRVKSPSLLVAVGSSPMDDGDESDPENGELVSTVRLVVHDAEAKSDEAGDDHVLSEIELASCSDTETADSIG